MPSPDEVVAREAGAGNLLIPAAVSVEMTESDGSEGKTNVLPVLLWNGNTEQAMGIRGLPIFQKGADFENTHLDTCIELLRHDGKIAVFQPDDMSTVKVTCLVRNTTLDIDWVPGYEFHQVTDRFTLLCTEDRAWGRFYDVGEGLDVELDLSSFFKSTWSESPPEIVGRRPAFLIDLDRMLIAEVDLSTWTPVGALVKTGSARLLLYGPAKTFAVVDAEKLDKLIGPTVGTPSFLLMHDLYVSLDFDEGRGDDAFQYSVWSIKSGELLFHLSQRSWFSMGTLPQGGILVESTSVPRRVALVLPNVLDSPEPPAIPGSPPRVFLLDGWDRVERIGMSGMLEAVPVATLDGRASIVAANPNFDLLVPTVFSEPFSSRVGADGQSVSWSRLLDGGYLALREFAPHELQVFESIEAPDILSSTTRHNCKIQRYILATRFGEEATIELEMLVFCTSDLRPLKQFGSFQRTAVIDGEVVWSRTDGSTPHRRFAGLAKPQVLVEGVEVRLIK
ncbi:hypothetical protein ABWH91_15635 [Phycisphaerales bacterium ac7]